MYINIGGREGSWNPWRRFLGDAKSLFVSMLAGAAIGLIIISLFVFLVDDPDPEWAQFWKVSPLIIILLARALGIFFLPEGLFQTTGKLYDLSGI